MSADDGQSGTQHGDRFLAAYARFAQAIAGIPDARAQELQRAASRVASFVETSRANDPAATDDHVANGLAQGLLEMPLLFDGIDAHWRWAVSRALFDALAAESPELLELEAQRLREILARGCIADDAEFLLVRHCVDVLEGQAELPGDLKGLHALLQAHGPGA